ncbi:MAG: PorV/PorQ family protein [bacterium]
MKFHHIFIPLFLFLSPLLFGQGSSTGSSHLKLPTNAQDASLGQSRVASTGSLHSASLNPATIYTTHAPQVLISHTSWIQDLQRQLIQARFPLLNGTTALAVSSFSLNGIELREQPGAASGTFNATSAVFEAAYSTPLDESLTIGIATRYLYEKIFIDEATGYGIDIGALYQVSLENLSVGLAVTNLGSMKAFRSVAGTLPTTVRIGAQYHYPVSDVLLTPTFAFSNETHTGVNHVHAGMEGLYDNLLAVRFGYVTGYDSRGFSAGIGIHYTGIQLDYAYLPFSLGLGDAHILSLAFQF